MSSSRPLDEPQVRRRRRHRRTWIAFVVMLAALVAAAGYVIIHAGRWGVPMFSFTNEYGSTCRNDWLGHTCTVLTTADIERHLGVAIPEGTTLLRSHWKQTHDYELTARLTYPAARGRWTALDERYGPCRPGLPSPLSDLPDLDDACVMTNEGAVALGRTPDPQIWRIATATEADGAALVDVRLRSR